jgi:hypothetical protein
VANGFSAVGVATALRASAGLQAATTVTADAADFSTAIRIEVLAAGGGGATRILRQMMMGHG